MKAKESEMVSFEEVFGNIKSGKYQEWLDLIKEFKAEGNENDVKLVKEDLPCFTVSGRFEGRRTTDSIVEYSNLLVLDYDNVDNVEKLKETVIQDEKTMAAFISPSRNGLKVIVKVDSDLEDHKLAFNQVKDYYEKKFKYNIDRSGSDVTRLCLFSSDPKIFVNWDSEVFVVDLFADEKTVNNESKIKKNVVVGDNSQEYQTVIEILDYLNENGLSITKAYDEWFKVGQALSNTFDIELGGKLYQSFAKQAGEKYDSDGTERQWQRAISDDSNEIGFATIVYLAQQVGFHSLLKHKFWFADDKGKVGIDQLAFGEYLAANGFGKTEFEGNYIFIRVECNVAHFVGPTEIKDFLKERFDTKEKFGDFTGREILRKMVNGSSTYMSRGTLEWMPTLNIERNWDAKEESFIYYKNGALKITSDKTELIDYSNLGKIVWEHEILDREWEYQDFITQSDFWRFLEYIAKDKDRIDALHTSIGYLLHRYKDPAQSVAVTFMEEQENEFGEANGGTGKSLIGKAISKIRNVIELDGKNFRFREFAFQSVRQNTNVLVFDDVTLRFNFERLYSAITSDMSVEMKGKTPFVIPFAYSPKMLLSTNYDVSGGGGTSEERRLFKVEFSNFFSLNNRPVDVFGKRFFDEWKDEDWNLFDNVMVYCLQKFLRYGLMKYELINADKRAFVQNTSHEFVEYAEKYKVGMKYEMHQELRDYLSEMQPRFKDVSQRLFNKWVRYMMKARGWVTKESLGTNRDISSQGAKMYMTFIEKPESIAA
ncbi:BT4734/BF3469 family protein [Ekhidna sp.]